MRKLPYIAALLLVLAGGVACASGLAFPAGTSVTFKAGGAIAYPVQSGAITGYSTHPSTSSTCGGNAAYYRTLLNAGANRQRTDLFWKSVQPVSAASSDWTGYDCLVNDALALGIDTTFIIYSAPTWAAYPGCTANGATQCAPVDAATYGTFCTQAAAHFQGRVKNWEIWNEPNSKTFWSPSATSSDYVAALKSCYSAIKAVDPTNKVISGGLAQVSDSAPNIGITHFVSDIYANGGKGYFDYMGQHPYTFPQNLNEAFGDSTNNGWKAMLAVEGIMAANNDTSKIWITEYGAPTCGTGGAKDLGFISFGSTDFLTFQAQQALASQVISAVSGSSTIKGLFWYTLVDANSNNTSDRENCFGSFFTSLNGKPASAVLRSN